MAAPTGDANVISRLDEAVARIDLLETRLTNLTESVNTAVGTMMPKVEALLSRSRDEVGPTSSYSASSKDPASSTSLLEMAEQGDGEGIFQIVAERHFDIGDLQRTESGDTALHVAASRGHLKAVMAFLGAGAKVDVSGHMIRTPLHCAAAHGHLRVVQRLLNAGAQIDVKDTCGATALELSVKEGHCSVVELFLEKGMSADLCNEQSDTLLVQAAKAGQWKVVLLLLTKGASATKCKTEEECALRYAAEAGEGDTARLLLRLGAAPDPKQVLYGLGYAKSAAVVRAFVDVVPDAVRGKAGEWGLREAGCKGRLEPLVALLEAGVDIDARDCWKQTALFLAAWNGHVACVRELVGRGADINSKDRNGDTPLHKSSQLGKVECVRALLAAGASTTERNDAGKTPLEVAASDAVRQLFNAASVQS